VIENEMSAAVVEHSLRNSGFETDISNSFAEFLSFVNGRNDVGV